MTTLPAKRWDATAVQPVTHAPCADVRTKVVRASLGAFDVEVRGDHASALTDFAELYRDYLATGPCDNPIVRIEIVRETSGLFRRPRYRIDCDGETAFSDLRAGEVLPYIEWAANYRILSIADRFVILHAAALRWRGTGILLVGQSGSGKSTLAAALVAAGAEYLCDEFGLLDPANMRLHPFTKSLCLKSGAFETVRRMGLPLFSRRSHVKALKGRVGYVPPHAMTTARESVPPSLLVFPRFMGRQSPRHYPMARGQAVFELAASVLNAHAHADRGMAALTRLAGQAKAFSVETGEITQSVSLIESLADRVSA